MQLSLDGVQNDGLNSLISDLTIVNDDEAPAVQLHAISVNNTTTDVEPQVEVSVNSVHVITQSATPSIVINASAIDLVDAQEVVIVWLGSRSHKIHLQARVLVKLRDHLLI